MNFLLHYLPAPGGTQLETLQLPPVPNLESENRRRSGFRDRTVIAFGHCMGADVLYALQCSYLVLVANKCSSGFAWQWMHRKFSRL